MHIAVIGTGYVGLVTGACFAEFGVDVTCVDVDTTKIEKLNNGVIPIYEPGLDQIVEKNVKAGGCISLPRSSSVEGAQVSSSLSARRRKTTGRRTCLTTSRRRRTSRSDERLQGPCHKVHVPIGTGKWLREFRHANLKTRRIWRRFNPEFLREGAAIDDFMRPDRVVIGSNEERAIEVMKELYRPLYLIETRSSSLARSGRADQVCGERISRDEDHFHQ
jgi:UDPglucose 6-dehydrogenase